MKELVSRFYDSTEEKEFDYDAEQWSEVFAYLAGNGVMPGEFEEFNMIEFDPLQMKVIVKKGVCFIRGRYGLLDEEVELEIPEADGSNDRIDRVILKLDLRDEAKSITLEIKEGTPASTPEPPALERSENIYEVSLHQIYVGAGVTSVSNADFTDERNNLEVCGYSLPFGWLVQQRVISAPRKDVIDRDGDGNVTETRHYVPKDGVLRWKEEMSRDGDGEIIEVDRTAYADDGSTVVMTAKETISRDADGNITEVVTE